MSKLVKGTQKATNDKATTTQKATNDKALIELKDIASLPINGMLNEYFTRYGKILCNNTNKQERKETMRNTIGRDFPHLAINGYDRASDVPTIFCKMHGNGHSTPQQEKYRSVNGNVKIIKEGKSWKVELNLLKPNKEAEKDLQQLGNGEMRFNLSNISSEERHVVALAKLFSIKYNLAFSIAKDKEVRELKENIGRGEVYKYASKMTI